MQGRNSGPGLVKFGSLVSSAIHVPPKLKFFESVCEVMSCRAQQQGSQPHRIRLKSLLFVRAWPVQIWEKSLSPFILLQLCVESGLVPTNKA